ncbi:MAG: TetR/AcrR family transcriptional regulator [Myxococcales bacterium]|nr:TetR/AcrR family transcriptional regulator [Myxococcales bacterium]
MASKTKPVKGHKGSKGAKGRPSRSPEKKRATVVRASAVARHSDVKRKVLGAARAIVDRGGLRALTMDALANEAGIGRTLLFYYFRSRDEVAAALAQEYAGEEADALLSAIESARDAVDAAVVFLNEMVRFHSANLARFRAQYLWGQVLGEARAEGASRPMTGALLDTLELRILKAQQSGAVRASVVAPRAARFVHGLALGLLVEHSLAGGEGVLDTHNAEVAVRAVFNA